MSTKRFLEILSVAAQALFVIVAIGVSTVGAQGLGGAGTVHHVAWSSSLEEHEAWHARVTSAGVHPSPVIDRFWFRSIYFREPSGVLFEIATLGPGFSLDEDLEHLGEKLILPPAFEHLRAQVEPVLTPLPDPRPWTTIG